MHEYLPIRELVDAVRRRWRTVRAFGAVVRASLASSLIILAALLASRFTQGSPVALSLLGLLTVGLVAVAAWMGLRSLGGRPDDRSVARFIEERTPSLDDRLVSAVDVASQASQSAPGLAGVMVADAARRIQNVGLDDIIPAETVRRAGFQAVASALVVVILLVTSRHAARQTFDALSLTLFPARVGLQVTPGNQRVKAGTPLAIEARLVGNRAPVAAQLQVASGA